MPFFPNWLSQDIGKLSLALSARHSDNRLDEYEKGLSQLLVTTALAMSGRLDAFIAGVRAMQTLEPLTCKEVISFSARRSHVN
jgi:hypothetical protein